MDRIQQMRRTALACALLGAVTLAVFALAGRNGFVSYDDPDYVTENPRVLGGLNGASVAWAFGTGHAGNWHPLTWLSHMLDCQIYGLKPAGHHLTSLFLHIGNSLLLFGLFQRLTGAFWRSAMVAALFALHPLHVESVAWVAERKDVLSGFFFLLTLWAYVRYAKGRMQNAECRMPVPERGSSFCILPSAFYLLALVFFALGLMSKPMLVTVPFVLLLLDYWPLGRMRKEECRMQKGEADSPKRNTPHARRFILRPSSFILLEKLPFFILAAASCVVTFLIQRAAGAVSSLEALPLEFRISNALISYLRYAGKMVWPANLAVFYPAPAEWPAAWVAGAALLLAAVSVLAIRSVRKAPWFPFGWFWYLGMLVPVIGIVQVGQQAMADRYTYIPLIGLFVAIVWGGAQAAARWPRTRNWLAAGAAAALAACAVLTWRQIGHWRSSTTLFEHALAVTRDNHVAHNNLGVILFDEGNLAAAAEHFEEAVRLKRNYPEGLGNLGLCHLKQGRPEEAAELLSQSLRVRPTAVVQYNLGNLLSQQGKLDEAQTCYEAALRRKPEFVEAYYNLGLLQAKRGRTTEAERNYRTALRLKPNHAESHLSLGTLLAGEKKPDEALAHFQAAVQAAPTNVDARFNLALALNGRGDYAGAAAQFAEACRLQPEDVEARQSLALALLGAGKMAEATAQFREALRLRPDARMHHYLALALDSQARTDEALPHYQAAARLNPDAPLYLNDLAWFLATNPKPELRDGAEAVRLAESARDLSGGNEARVWGTLDAAYAEAGRFAEALAAAAKARELALATGQTDIARQAEERIALYRAAKPYRAAAPSSPDAAAEGRR
ncbi:MAG TPA: tetratricopeptide repeat protein [Verrucomicrobiota bacterium]|nr:tetratricopeptide repeat protein [Verrucomicrobiota bacterium]HQL78152.1 tetratricopeptide repeat protein [Verrucomicrobiota bacterium]